MNAGDIYLAHFPFGGSAGRKLRPVLLLTDPIGTVPEVVTAYISSVIPNTSLPSDVLIDPSHPDYQSSNLRMKSVLRLHKLATIHCGAAVRFVGTVSATALQTIRTTLCSM